MDSQSTARRAAAALKRRAFDEAISAYEYLLDEPNESEKKHREWVRGLASALLGAGRNVEACYAFAHAQDYDRVKQLLPKSGADRGRLLVLCKEYSQASEAFLAEDLPIHAAVALESIAETGSAKVKEQCHGLWQQVVSRRRLEQQPYEQALAYFNLARAARRVGSARASEHHVSCQRLLEVAADVFESSGLRERAFDCYQILLEMGRGSGAFENLAEGYINSVRILKSDNLKHFALQYYERFAREAESRSEFAAGAALFREAADYCVKSGMIYAGAYLRRSAAAWMQASQTIIQAGEPAELAENALLAAVDCLNRVGDHAAVKMVYKRLAALELQAWKVERYSKIHERYPMEAAQSVGSEQLPGELREQSEYPDIWLVDLLEWEAAGDPKAAACEVLNDDTMRGDTRRRALKLVIAAHRGDSADTLANLLGDLRVYVVFSPLEKLFEQGDRAGRVAVMRSLRYLFFKRSFVLLGQGLRDDDIEVRTAAVAALRRLHFGHALAALIRIVGDFGSGEVRSAAIECIGRVRSVEAGEFLVTLMRQERGPDRAAAVKALEKFRHREFWQLLKQSHLLEAQPLRGELAKLLKTHQV